MSLVAPHLAWPELERRARLDLTTFKLPHQPEASACCGLWQWFSLGPHVTWAMFKTKDGDFVVQARWDRGEASEFIALRAKLPVPSEQLRPRVIRHTVRAPAGLVDRTIASLRTHEPVSTGASLGLDGIDCGFEVADGNHLRRVSWREYSLDRSASTVFTSCLKEIRGICDKPD